MKTNLLSCDKCHAFVPHKKIAEIYAITSNTESMLTVYVWIDCGESQIIHNEKPRKDENF